MMMHALIVLPLLFAVSFGYFTSDAIFQTKDEGEAYCNGLGSNLASIHDFDDLVEAQALCRVLPQASGTRGCWLGLEQASESDPWFWSDGSPFDYGTSFSGQPWNAGEPNGGNGENCLHIAAHVSWNWNDVPCNGPYEQYALCNGGCGSAAVEERSVIANKIYACRGTFTSGGVYGDAAEALCGDGYHVCKSALEVEGLGLTTEACAAVAQSSNEFFATQETSDGNLNCYSHNGGSASNIGSKYNDIWGCAERDGTYSYTGSRADECGVLTGWVGQRDINGWKYQGDHEQEAVQTVLDDASSGGVLCCVDSCASTGASYDPSHFCECQASGQCGGAYCHPLDEIAGHLGQPTGQGKCKGSSACCCSCPDCDGFTGFAD